jgi:hypothetical protein
VAAKRQQTEKLNSAKMDIYAARRLGDAALERVARRELAEAFGLRPEEVL